MITINKSVLKAAARFAPKSDVRYYLVGVYVEATENETRIIATDGHTMFVHRQDVENTHCWNGIIPLDAVNAILKHKSPYEKKNSTLPVELSEPGGTECRIDYAGQAFVFKPVDGTFPDYRRVVPDKINGEPAAYQADYLKRVSDAASDLNVVSHGMPIYAVGYNGNGTGIFGINDCCFALVMPVRAELMNADTVRAYQWGKAALKSPAKLQAVA